MRKKVFIARILVLFYTLSLGQFSIATEPDNDVSQPSGLEIAADLMLGRPAGAVATVLGTGVWIIGLPFNAAGGNVKGSANTLIVTPAKSTFWRCLGCPNAGYKRD